MTIGKILKISSLFLLILTTAELGVHGKDLKIQPKTKSATNDILQKEDEKLRRLQEVPQTADKPVVPVNPDEQPAPTKPSEGDVEKDTLSEKEAKEGGRRGGRKGGKGRGSDSRRGGKRGYGGRGRYNAEGTVRFRIGTFMVVSIIIAGLCGLIIALSTALFFCKKRRQSKNRERVIEVAGVL